MNALHAVPMPTALQFDLTESHHSGWHRVTVKAHGTGYLLVSRTMWHPGDKMSTVIVSAEVAGMEVTLRHLTLNEARAFVEALNATIAEGVEFERCASGAIVEVQS